MILSYDANLGWMEFSERTPVADIPKFIEISLLSAQEGSRPRLQLMPRLIRRRHKSPFPSRTLFGNYGISFAGCRGAIHNTSWGTTTFQSPQSDIRCQVPSG